MSPALEFTPTIAASDLVPEVNKHPSARTSLVHFLALAAGVALL